MKTIFKKVTLILFSALSVFFMLYNNSCSNGNKEAIEDSLSYMKAKNMQNGIPLEVFAISETVPVNSKDGEDAADDPAIWMHPTDISKSLILGTNKKMGLCVYNLDGEEIKFLPLGKVNNVDVRYNFTLAKQNIDIIVASNRTTGSFDILYVDTTDLSIHSIAFENPIVSVGEVYGITLYKNAGNKKFYAFVSGKKGKVEQFELIEKKGKIQANSVRIIDINSICEGMVVDDYAGTLFIAEENVGIWKIDANPNSNVVKEFLTHSTKNNNPMIEYDIEGLAIYYLNETEGYIIASSQGNFSYAVFERQAPYNYITSFKVTDSTIDGIEETDGLDVLNMPMGSKYPNGLFIAQDGFNLKANEKETQNFKMVDWSTIVLSSKQKLKLNTSFNIRL